jgi:hypothetical protein
VQSLERGQLKVHSFPYSGKEVIQPLDWATKTLWTLFFLEFASGGLIKHRNLYGIRRLGLRPDDKIGIRTFVSLIPLWRDPQKREESGRKKTSDGQGVHN